MTCHINITTVETTTLQQLNEPFSILTRRCIEITYVIFSAYVAPLFGEPPVFIAPVMCKNLILEIKLKYSQNSKPL